MSVAKIKRRMELRIWPRTTMVNRGNFTEVTLPHRFGLPRHAIAIRLWRGNHKSIQLSASSLSLPAGRWRWPALWAAIILIATSIPGSAILRVGLFPGADKLVHSAMYGVLAALCVWAARPVASVSMSALILAAVLAFAAVDEWHQRYIAGRSPDPMDWGADAAGATAATLLLTRARARREMPS